jgi:hypothetical protein
VLARRWAPCILADVVDIRADELKKIPYIDPTAIGDRSVYLLPFWDGQTWRLWMPQQDGTLFEMNPRSAIQTDYVAKQPASPDDLPIYFVDFMWQTAAWPEVQGPFRAILDDFHNLATSVAKVDHFFECYSQIGFGGTLFVATELEYMLIQCRSIFDQLQETISRLWQKRVRLSDAQAQKKKRTPSNSFADVVFEKQRIRDAKEITQKYQFPSALSEAYVEVSSFFASIRSARDRIVHGLGDRQLVFHTERGWCVSPNDPSLQAFARADVWKDAHRFNEALVSLRPLLAHWVFGTVSACGQMMNAFSKEVAFPAPIAPGYTVFVRGLHGGALVRLDRVIEGGSPWWRDEPQPAEDAGAV